MNLSLVWVVLVLIFTYKLLLSLNGLYFEVIQIILVHRSKLNF